MQVKETSIEILNQLVIMSEQLTDAEFSAELDLLSNNSIGKHLRHIIEFYVLLIDSLETGIVCYDSRTHNKQLENDRNLAIATLENLKKDIEAAPNNVDMQLKGNYSLNSDAQFELSTSYLRELVYNIEHAIHHMAIIKIAVRTVFPRIELPQNFGIAYSTVKYQAQES